MTQDVKIDRKPPPKWVTVVLPFAPTIVMLGFSLLTGQMGNQMLMYLAFAEQLKVILA